MTKQSGRTLLVAALEVALTVKVDETIIAIPIQLLVARDNGW